MGELDSSLGGLYEPWTTTLLTYTLIRLSGLKGAGRTKGDKTPSVAGYSSDELRGSSGYIYRIIVSKEKLHPRSEKTSGTARLGKDYNSVIDDSVGYSRLDEVRKIKSI
jgi:hypothetical protein